MAKSILGVHHVTAIAGDPDPNLDFYTRLLGLRFSPSFCGPACAAATQLRSGSEQSPELKKEDCK